LFAFAFLVFGGDFFFFPLPRRATFFGPYHHLLGIRASGWFAWLEECMVAIVEKQELEEDFASIDASIGDLVGGSEAKVMAGKT
jgi:hypothetical protein